MEQNKNELVKECNKKVADYKTKWEELTSSIKSKLELINNANIEQAEQEELDEMSEGILNALNIQIEISKEGENLLDWIKDNNLKGNLNPKDLENLEACIGANTLTIINNLDELPQLGESIEKIEKTNKIPSKNSINNREKEPTI